jgi:hypothetical protein
MPPRLLMLVMSWLVLGCSSSPEAVGVSQWTMTSWSAGHAWVTSGERGTAQANVDGVRLSACSKGKREPRGFLGALLSR